MRSSFFCIACFLFLPGAFAQKQAENKIKYYCSPCGCSNDGKIFDSAGKCPVCGMWLMQTGVRNYSMPSVSKNDILVYASDIDGGKQQVFYRGINSSKEKEIGEGSSPHISADGKKIVYSKGDNGIFIYDLITDQTTDLGPKIKLPNLQTPSWGPDNSIVFAAGTFPDIKIYLMNLDDEKITLLTEGEGFRYACVVSPDNKTIAYRCSKGQPGPDRQRGIALLDLNSKEEKFITNIGEYCSWSPDGKKLAFHWADSSKGFCIYTVNADGTELKKIAAVKELDSELPVWLADGKKIFFQTNRRHGNWELWTMNADGTEQKPFLPKE